MKYSLLLAALLSASVVAADTTTTTNTTTTLDVPAPAPVYSAPAPASVEAPKEVLEENQNMLISVVGQGVAPMHTTSPAQAYALAKRAAVADAYRLIAEKVKGVRIDGQDVIKNMMVQRSTVRTAVNAMVRNATVVETTFKEGLCEVEMEITINYSQFVR